MNIFLKLIKYSIKNLLIRKSRTLLTSLGIIIGTATIAVVVGIGAGAQQNVEDQYSNLSVTTIFVNPSGENMVSKNSEKDAELIMQEAKYISSAIPQISNRFLFSNGAVSEQYTLVGTSNEFAVDLNFEYIAGGFFSEIDEDTKAKKIVLGYNIAESLFGVVDASAIGQRIKIDSKEFEVIGIVKYRGGSIGKIAIDDSGFAPISSAAKYVIGTKAKVTIVLQANSIEVIEQAMTEARSILRESHKLNANDTDDFKIKDMGTTVRSAIDSARTMSFLMGSVATIILIVGGIGIMNIMYISIEERTREIGIRKALGAKYKHILYQFVLEAGIISFFGSMVGIIIAILIYYVLDQLNYTAIPVLWGFLLAFSSSIIIGIFFGYYPAKKAAKMRPIDALKYD